MSEKKYAVPDGMLEAAWLAIDRSDFEKTIGKKGKLKIALEAAIRWQSSRSPNISAELLDLLACDAHVSKVAAYDIVDIALRRIYLAPEPEVPEDIKGMQYINLASIENQAQLDRLVTELNVVAFNRGVEAERDIIINKNDKEKKMEYLLRFNMAKELENLLSRGEERSPYTDKLISESFLCGRESVVSIFEEQEKSGEFTKEEIIDGIKSICESRHGRGEKK